MYVYKVDVRIQSMFYIEGRELMALRRSVNLYVEPIDINSCFNK